MIRLYFTSLLLSFCACQASLGQNLLDSINTNTSASEQVEQLNELSFKYSQNDPKLALAFAQQALQLATDNDDSVGIASSLHKFSVTYRFQGLYDKALHYGDSALAILESNPNEAIAATIYTNQGVSYRYKGDYEKALSAYQKAIEIHKTLDHKSELGTVLNNLGVMYMSLEEYGKALKYYQEALEIQIALGNKKEQANVYNNFAIIFANQGILDSALTYFEKSYEMEEALGNRKGMSESMNNIGAVYYYLGDFDNAILRFEQSFAIDSSLGDIRGQIACKSNIGELYNEMGQSGKALEYLNWSLKNAREIDSKYDIEIAYLNLSQSYTQLGRHQEALENYIAYANIHDTVLGQERMEAIAEMETRYQTKEKEQQIIIQELEIEDKEKDLRARNTTILGLAIAVLLVLLTAILGYRNIQAKKAIDMERTLRQAEERRLDAVIDATETERKRISRELHDGIGQQLSSIKLGMNTLDESEKETLQEKLKRIRAIVDESAQDVRNLSHQMMPKSLLELGLAAAIEDMLNKSLGIGGIQHTFDTIQMDARLPEKIEVNLFRVVQEITNNILKHSEASEVDIQLYRSQGNIHLIYAENGKGYDPTNSKDGHGVMNMETRIRRLGGTIRMEKQSDNQFVITIKVPID